MSLRDELQAIYDEHGKLTPDLVVQAARPKTHPLHDRVFDKAVGEAAESWYRLRARDLIQSVRVVYREATDAQEEASIRFFQAVQAEDNAYVYEPVRTVAQSEFLTALVLQNMEREWKALHRRYEHFVEFLDMVKADVEAA